ncbi:MAG TPA: M1 family aminopeptidase [Candidatus Eisenbacteria bacterium]|nr:M1 family aminopeptidase [Candidatus Eisenbacteria bacterium]
MKRRSFLARGVSCALLVTTVLVARPARAQENTPEIPGAAAPVAIADSVSPPAADFTAFHAAFLGQRLDSTRVAHVSGLVLERDAGRFVLEQGELFLATPVQGRVCAAVFMGSGTFTLTPPVAVEREQVRRHYGGSTVERRFASLVLIAADSTIDELRRVAAFEPGTSAKTGNATLTECLKYVSEKKTHGIDASLAKPFLEGRSNGYFFSMIDSLGKGRLFYEIDPQRVEEVTLWREPKARYLGLLRVWRRDDVCMFKRRGARAPESVGDTRLLLAVKRHRVDCRITGSMGFSATAELELESRDTAPQHWATLTLFDRLVVDSVAWAGGRAAPYSRYDENDRLWVRCEPPLQPGETRTLRVSYHGKLIDRLGDWMLLGTSTEWYPEPDGRQRAPFELTFHTPSQYHLASVGERVSSETQGRTTTTRWISERPISNASFVLGLFDEEEFGGKEPPPVVALMFRGKPDPVRISFGDVQVVSGARMTRQVANDATRAVEFFFRNLGPPPVPRVVVAEIPNTRGEAFPGLVQLTWTPFWGRNVAAEDAVFRAHEVAHQWWGHGVEYRTYHDHWLSEGFADFSALWYLQQGVGDTKSYLAVLDSWREDIVDDMTLRPADSPPAGPIWLGYRSASIEAPGDHQMVVYKKSAWVLHMLRNMLLDLSTGNEEAFQGLMRDFYARYEGKAATTEDFIRIAQRYAGQDLGWFFDQWVYGTDVPTYRFATRTERTTDGKYKVTCRVDQSGVPETFKMPVPVRIDFAGGRSARVRQLIQGPTTEFVLPIMDEEPRAVVFNDLESVLCRVEQVRW